MPVSTRWAQIVVACWGGTGLPPHRNPPGLACKGCDAGYLYLRARQPEHRGTRYCTRPAGTDILAGTGGRTIFRQAGILGQGAAPRITATPFVSAAGGPG
jgi:hypothetical protein